MQLFDLTLQETCQELRKARSVIRLKQMGKEVQVRFVGEKYPDIENNQAEPTLEDYYMFTSGITNEGGIRDEKE